ncbi:DUF6306 domain-containing protein [Oceanibacterium hippocampi]|uniref:DUF6306 domain-containing protein n=1 Tax=Oceanibacterium hippocampi TaxID=745714 RepID=A0A1Y5S9G1_9PROT|nr:DUF6306 domain-containing protein [Oceanibacterium hippocampi]SLN34831.1 hypothetical protein OCH7691_01369 [Oceanibacterium hippocampi]
MANEEAGNRNEGASPPCAMAEAPPDYMGYLPPAELAVALNELLEAERAGARTLAAWLRDDTWPATARATLEAARDDEARYCALLTDFVGRLGAEPSKATGSFLEKALRRETPDERLAFLNRGQDWVAKRLGELLPRIADDAIHAGLREMRDRHVNNIAAAEALIG